MTTTEQAPAATVRFERIPVGNERDVVVLWLNRPAKRNAVNSTMLAELGAHLDDIAEDSTVGAVVLTGTGAAFGAGADIQEYAAADPDTFRAFTGRANEVCRRIAELPQPVVAAVNGLALGGAFELVLCADIVIAADDAQFGLPEVGLGLIPGWGGTQRLAAAIGPGRAKYVIMTGKRISATEALALGLAHEVCPTVSVVDRASMLAADLAGGPACAIDAAKFAINRSRAELDQGSVGRRAEEQRLIHLFSTHDAAEGIRAFVDKRSPRFTGR